MCKRDLLVLDRLQINLVVTLVKLFRQPLDMERELQGTEHLPDLLVQYLLRVPLLWQHRLRTVVDLGQNLLEGQRLQLLTVRCHHVDAHLNDSAPADAEEVVPKLKQTFVYDPILRILFECLREDSDEPS